MHIELNEQQAMEQKEFEVRFSALRSQLEDICFDISELISDYCKVYEEIDEELQYEFDDMPTIEGSFLDFLGKWENMLYFMDENKVPH